MTKKSKMKRLISLNKVFLSKQIMQNYQKCYPKKGVMVITTDAVVTENGLCTVEECYSKNKYGQEWTFCHKKGNEENVCWKKQRDDKEK